MARFIGRDEEMARLHAVLQDVRRTGTGRMLAIRGRRRIGKSRLVEEWLQREAVPHVYFEAARRPAAAELAAFAAELARSDLPAASLARSGLAFQQWDAALGSIAATTAGSPAVIVIDEFPYLFYDDPTVDSVFQRAWDREIDHRAPVLLILIGSDLSMMEQLASYDRALYGRMREMVVNPLSPAEVASVLECPDADAIDAYTVLGGYPALVETWRPGETLWGFLERELEPTSPLLVNGERMLSSELPGDLSPRRVLEAIGTGERTYTSIANVAGVPASTLNRALDVLIEDKRVVAAQTPLSTRPQPQLKRYHVADPYLRFWLRFMRPAIPEIERSRADLALARIRTEWQTYLGRAVEPLVREAVTRMLPDPRFGDARHCGGFWNRANDVEVDLVGADREPVARSVSFAGSIKWRAGQAFDRRDLASLTAALGRLPGAASGTRLVGVSRAGFMADGLEVALGPGDLLAAFRPCR